MRQATGLELLLSCARDPDGFGNFSACCIGIFVGTSVLEVSLVSIFSLCLFFDPLNFGTPSS